MRSDTDSNGIFARTDKNSAGDTTDDGIIMHNKKCSIHAYRIYNNNYCAENDKNGGSFGTLLACLHLPSICGPTARIISQQFHVYYTNTIRIGYYMICSFLWAPKCLYIYYTHSTSIIYLSWRIHCSNVELLVKR